MSVILGSEIARLVFGYLQEEQLDEAATAFCKTCPYLVEEYDWLQRGYRACKINDLCLVDIIREHCEIKYAVSEYIESLPLSVGETLKIQKSLSGKINSIFDLLSSNQSKPDTPSRKRPYSMIGSNSTEATQSNELPGYEPALKERRLSRKLILRRDCTPKTNSTWNPTLKQNAQDVYVSDDQDEENTSPAQGYNPERSRAETSQYPIFTNTILENTQFQNVLVDNINRMLENSSDRMEVSAESGAQLNETNPNNNSLQEQVNHALDNIIMSTERHPAFEQVLNECVQHTTCQEQTSRSPLTSNDNQENSDGNSDSPVPLKQRLRNRSQDKPRPNYNETDQNSKKKRKAKVEVISNEIVSGEIRDLLHPTTTIRSDNYVPLNQILYLNSTATTATTFSQDPVYVNVGVPSFPLIRIDADTPMYLNDISMLNNGTSTSLAPGSIINIPTVEQLGQPIQSMLPSNLIIKDVVEENRTKNVQIRSEKSTPNASKNMVQVKSRSLTTPRRQSHVRSLNFTTSDDVINENERLTDKRNDDARRTEPISRSSLSKSPAMRNNETDNTKTSLEEVEQQQDSSDAVDFSKEFDEATVISVELSPVEGVAKLDNSKEEKSAGTASEKKKPQTRRQSQKDLEKWNQMRQVNKGEWDNYLRQTVALKTDNAPVEKKKVKKRKPKSSTKSSEKSEGIVDDKVNDKSDEKLEEMNVSTESANNSTTDIQARLLEEALESAKKPVSPVIKKSSTSEPVSTESAKETNISEPSKPHSPSVPPAPGSSVKHQRSPNKRSSGRNQLIKIKLPASAKKKFTKSKKRKIKPPVKRSVNTGVKSEEKQPTQPQRPSGETTRIDPEQPVDIDLISPIEYPRELNYVVKSNINLTSFLETPCKESTSFKFPITPGLAVSSSLKTPGVRLVKLDYDSSLIKFPEYPTPSFPITPGCSKTPLSQTSSQKDGSSYNRATDYSSGSSYYKPDESDDIDKNLDVIIKENRGHLNIGGLGVDPQQNIKLGNDEPLSEDEELSESSKNSSTSSSSSSSTSSDSTCSSSPNSTIDTLVTKEVHDAKILTAQRTQKLKLDQVRQRMIANLKSDKKIERFRKPKPKISTLHRHKVTQPLKMSGNSTPKVAAKVAPKHVTKPVVKLPVKQNQKPATTTPSKRKIATPRRVIYWDNNEPLKTGSRTGSHERKPRPAEQLLVEPNDNATFKPVQESKQLRPPTPTETIDAIENHIAKTSQTSFEECVVKLKNDNQVDTPNLIQQLQGKADLRNKVVTPEMGPPACSKRALVRELFGDGTMSDSDFMDTPVKGPTDSRNQAKIVPISHATVEISKDSITKDSTEKISPTKASITKNLTAKFSGGKDSIAKDSAGRDSTVKGSVSKDLIDEDSVGKYSVSKDSTSKGSIAKASIVKNAVSKDSAVKDSVAKDSITKASFVKGSIVKDNIAKVPSARTSSSKDSTVKDSSSKNLNAKDSSSKNLNSKDLNSKCSSAKDSNSKDSSAKVSNASPKNSIAKSSVPIDSIAKDSTSKKSSANETISKHGILKAVSTKDSVNKEEIVHLEKDLDIESISKPSEAKYSTVKDSNLEDPSSTASATPSKQSKPPVTTDSDSETDDDEEDDFEDCIMISATHKEMPNRIYHHVTSDSIECPTEVNRQCIDLRPLTTFFDQRKIVMKACDEIILFSSAPKTNSPQSTSGGSKKLVSNRKTIKVVQSAKSKVDADQKMHKTDTSVNPNEHASVAPEKHFRFKLVAKHKGPADAPSSQISSSRDIPRKILLQSEESQQNAGTSNQMKKSSLHTKIPPLLKDMDINKVLGKIHPSNEIS